MVVFTSIKSSLLSTWDINIGYISILPIWLISALVRRLSPKVTVFVLNEGPRKCGYSAVMETPNHVKVT